MMMMMMMMMIMVVMTMSISIARVFIDRMLSSSIVSGEIADSTKSRPVYISHDNADDDDGDDDDDDYDNDDVHFCRIRLSALT